MLCGVCVYDQMGKGGVAPIFFFPAGLAPLQGAKPAA